MNRRKKIGIAMLTIPVFVALVYLAMLDWRISACILSALFISVWGTVMIWLIDD